MSNVRRLEPGKNVRWEITVGAGLQRRRDHRAECHHGLLRRGRHLHQRRQDVGGAAGTHRRRSGRLERVRESRLHLGQPSVVRHTGIGEGQSYAQSFCTGAVATTLDKVRIYTLSVTAEGNLHGYTDRAAPVVTIHSGRATIRS